LWLRHCLNLYLPVLISPPSIVALFTELTLTPTQAVYKIKKNLLKDNMMILSEHVPAGHGEVKRTTIVICLCLHQSIILIRRHYHHRQQQQQQMVIVK